MRFKCICRCTYIPVRAFLFFFIRLNSLLSRAYRSVPTIDNHTANNKPHVLFRTYKFNRNRVYRITDVDGAAEALVAAKSVVIVPGYGLGESCCTELSLKFI